MDGNGQLQGWHPDPFGRFEERYFLYGEPTTAVRSEGVESSDAPGGLFASYVTPMAAAARTGAAPETTTSRLGSDAVTGPTNRVACGCGAVNTLPPSAPLFVCEKCEKQHLRCEGCGKYVAVHKKNGTPARPNASWTCGSCHHENGDQLARWDKNLKSAILTIFIVDIVVFFVSVAAAQDRQQGAALTVGGMSLFVGFFCLLYLINCTATGRRIGNAAVAFNGKGTGSTKVVTVLHNGYAEHLDRKVQREIAKQQRQGYDLVSQHQEKSGWMTPSATLTFKKR